MTKYGVIILDPPWQFGTGRINGAAQNHYPTMSTDQIAALPVPVLAADDAVLFMWTTFSHVPDALRLIDAWGFTYVTGFPWVKVEEIQLGLPGIGDDKLKPRYGTGYWFRGCSELIFIARRGAVTPPRSDHLGILCDRMQHSRKPDNLYQMAEQLPGPWLEMFARRTWPGWSSWGNQVENSVII